MNRICKKAISMPKGIRYFKLLIFKDLFENQNSRKWEIMPFFVSKKSLQEGRVGNGVV
jgi:hypothetical protein